MPFCSTFFSASALTSSSLIRRAASSSARDFSASNGVGPYTFSVVAGGGDFWVKPVIQKPVASPVAVASATPEATTVANKDTDEGKAPVSLVVAAVEVQKRNNCFF